MGVLGLWDILNELSEHKPLTYLSGKRVAVDLSGWVVQAMTTNGLKESKNPHLRNLFFRVSHLLQNGAFPIFVTEGELTTLKETTVKERNSKNYHSKQLSNSKITRTMFDRVLLQCQDLLKSLGVPCIKSSGEAEAFCSFLCEKGLVDGVVTEDNDAFLYGADTVFRHFTMDRQDPHIMVYSLKSENNKLQLDRSKLVAFALLLGCDYGKGVSKIGKEAILKFISEVGNCDLLERFKLWKEVDENELFPYNVADGLKKPSHCAQCSHIGTLTNHKKGGCEMCRNKFQCNSQSDHICDCGWHKNQEHKAEIKIYNAVKDLPNFPNYKVIDEYLNYTDEIPNEDACQWKCPNLLEFQAKALTYLGWSAEKSTKKCVPIITLWHLYKRTSGNAADHGCLIFEPVNILNKCIVKGVPSLKVQWKVIGCADKLKLSDEDLIVVETAERFAESYSEISQTFYDSLKKKKSKPTIKPGVKGAKSIVENKKMTDYFTCKKRIDHGADKSIGTSNINNKRSLPQDLIVNEGECKRQCVQ